MVLGCLPEHKDVSASRIVTEFSMGTNALSVKFVYHHLLTSIVEKKKETGLVSMGNDGISWAALLAAFLIVFTGCTRNAGLPVPGSKEYRDLVTAFYVGLAGLQTGEDVRAKEKLTLATEIAPGEPAAWANLGLLAVRQQEFDTAYEKVQKARSLPPDNSPIQALLARI